MGKNKVRTPKQKLDIILNILQSENISNACREYGIYESQFYQWKKKLIDSADKIFGNEKKKDLEKEKIKSENERLKQTLIEQTCELMILKKER